MTIKVTAAIDQDVLHADLNPELVAEANREAIRKELSTYTDNPEVEVIVLDTFGGGWGPQVDYEDEDLPAIHIRTLEDTLQTAVERATEKLHD